MNEINPNWNELIGQVADRTGYPAGAVAFVAGVLMSTTTTSVQRILLTESDLCYLLHDRALDDYGYLARDQMRNWGIESTKDFGRIVLGLIEAKAIAYGDFTIEPYIGVFDFDTAFERRLYTPPSQGNQWKLSTIFILTGFIGVVVGGATRGGFVGAVTALFAGWLALIGGVCLWFTLRNREEKWLVPVVMGSLFLMAGIFAFFYFAQSSN